MPADPKCLNSPPPLPLVTTSLFSISVSLFLFESSFVIKYIYIYTFLRRLRETEGLGYPTTQVSHLCPSHRTVAQTPPAHLARLFCDFLTPVGIKIPWGPVSKCRCLGDFQCRGHGFHSWSGTKIPHCHVTCQPLQRKADKL